MPYEDLHVYPAPCFAVDDAHRVEVAIWESTVDDPAAFVSSWSEREGRDGSKYYALDARQERGWS